MRLSDGDEVMRLTIIAVLALIVSVWAGQPPAQTPPAALVAPVGQNIREAWAIDLLRALGNVTPTQDTITMVVEWTLAEDSGSGAFARNNPLNTTLCGHHQVGAINHDGACGVAGYQSYQDGIDATRDTLLQANFSQLAAALQANDADGARLALWASSWAESQYGGGASWPHAQKGL